MNWTCPYCHKAQVVTAPKMWTKWEGVNIADHALKAVGVRLVAVACASVECRKLSLNLALTTADYHEGHGVYSTTNPVVILHQRILPESGAKPQPDYIPTAIVEDYAEACKIVDLSPKASATLSRRCLQGMIRDFTKISRKTLYQEIIDLKKAVNAGNAPRGVSIESVDAIDHVRTVGNIGAHMEADVEHIIDVEPGEAQLLIELIESLFEEWYVERHTRTSRFAALEALADAKKLAKGPDLALPNPGAI